MRLIKLAVLLTVFFIIVFGLVQTLMPFFSDLASLLNFLPKVKLAVLLLVILVISGSLFQGSRGKRTAFWQNGWEEAIGYIGISLYLGSYLSANYIYVNGIIAFLVILFFIPDGISFVFSRTPREATTKSTPSLPKRQLPGQFLPALVALLLVVAGMALYQIDEKKRFEYEVSLTHPLITAVEPKLVTTFDLIMIKGTGFGEKVNDRYRVFGEKSGNFEVVDWNPNRVVFRLSTSLDPGGIRLAREAYFQNKYQEFESNPVVLDFYNVGEKGGEISRRWSEQYKSLSTEYLELMNKFPMSKQ